MIKFSREALSKTKAGKLIENERQLLLHEKIEEKKKKIAQGYEHGWILLEGDRPIFVRSRWEANLVFYFEFLKKQGKIKNWLYEHETFWFEGIKRGTNNYKPDFKIIENDDSEYFIEVKGYFTKKDAIKLKRMQKYHPNVRMKVLSNDKGFEAIHKNFPDLKFEKYSSYDMISENSYLIKGWNSPFKKKDEIQKFIPLPMKKPTSRKKPKPKQKGDQESLPF